MEAITIYQHVHDICYFLLSNIRFSLTSASRHSHFWSVSNTFFFLSSFFFLPCLSLTSILPPERQSIDYQGDRYT
ncbi:hypothetical protein BDV28DRAFT_59821 [Aspergillus coremiiformis]|uniref:Uncharacterized protein n=1 Tax=Aspergillus coremiiformis TaxID=138285 RepID=A0A5N6YX33_9EURO|nr:hypothetical protein BDV28DRAFT_59821 [Aspergillus coremiiformis]